MAVEESNTLFSTLTSFFLPTAHAEAPREDDAAEDGSEDVKEEDKEVSSEGEGEDAEEEEEEEEDDPEDQAPPIREECENKECQEPAKHFKACQDKVEAGQGWHGEDCVEELFHLMHCVDACAAPKLFKKLA